MIDLRLRSKIDPAELDAKIGKVCTPDDYNLLLTRAATVRKPDGALLCIYLPGAIEPALLDAARPMLSTLKRDNGNRGKAAATKRLRTSAGVRTKTVPVPSDVLGALDPSGQRRFCRLTGWTGRETEGFLALFPIFQAIAGHFAQWVPDRYAAQMAQVQASHPDWIIPGTPFSTITVNKSYPTGVHTDKGDLHEGFSTITVARFGDYTGGHLLFPEYRVGVDLGHGDLLLMDAHEWHGNTRLDLAPGADRFSIVCYYRTKIIGCASPAEEYARAMEAAERPHRGPAADRHAGEAVTLTAAGPPPPER